MGKMFKDNKFTFIVLIIFIVLFVIGAVLYGIVMPSSGKPAYGNRLDGIEKVALTKDNENKIVSALEKEDIVASAKTDIKGRIINVIIAVKEDTKVKEAKKLSDVIIKNLTEAQVGYFDIQMFVTCKDKKQEGYPFIGYKGNKQSKFTF